jgi:hypothetical protein
VTDSRVTTTGDNRLSFGQTHLDAGDFIPPRVKIIQAMSAEKDPKGTPVINEGDWYNTLTGECYGPSLRFLPILPFKQRIFLARADKGRDRAEELLGTTLSEGDGLKCRSYDMIQGQGEPGILCEACPLSRWEGQTPPPCSETYNVAGVTEMGDLIILGFSRSSAKTGKAMFSQLRLSMGLPWGFVYEGTTKEEKGAVGRYYVPTIRRVEKSTPELMTLAEHFARMLDGVVIDVTATDDEAPASTGATDPGFAPWEEAPAPTPAS